MLPLLQKDMQLKCQPTDDFSRQVHEAYGRILKRHNELQEEIQRRCEAIDKQALSKEDADRRYRAEVVPLEEEFFSLRQKHLERADDVRSQRKKSVNAVSGLLFAFFVLCAVLLALYSLFH